MSDTITMADMPKTNENIHIPQASFRPVLEKISTNPGADLLRYGWSKEGILSLAQGEGNRATPEFITAAMNRAIQEGRTSYGPTLGQMPLRQEISAYYENIYGQDVPADRIFVTASGSTGMHLALTSILEKGDDILAVTPIWRNLLGAIEITQARAIQVPLDHTPGSGWTLDMDKLFDSCTPQTRAMLIVSPSNPTGWTMTADQMREVLAFARQRGIWIIADEVYARLTFDSPRAPSFLDVAEPDDLLLVVNSFSKAWAMTGWRLGWLVGPKSAEKPIQDLAMYNNMCPCTFTQYGAVAALREGEPFIAEQMALWRSNRDLMMERLAQNSRIHIDKPDATFYAFFKVDGEEDCIALCRRLIDEALLSLAPGCSFGKCCAGWVRICFAVSEPVMLDALDRLESVVKP